RAAPAELLLDDAAREAVGHPAPAVLLREHEGCDPHLGGLVPDLPRHLRVGLVDGLRDRADLALRELAAEPLNLTLFVREPERLGSNLAHGLILSRGISPEAAECD